MDFSERDKCKPVLLKLSLAGDLEKPLTVCPCMGPNGGSVATDSERDKCKPVLPKLSLAGNLEKLLE